MQSMVLIWFQIVFANRRRKKKKIILGWTYKKLTMFNENCIMMQTRIIQRMFKKNTHILAHIFFFEFDTLEAREMEIHKTCTPTHGKHKKKTLKKLRN